MVERISTRAKRLRIEVRPDATVRLVIPRRVSKPVAYRFLDAHAAWIDDQIARVERRRRDLPPPTSLRWDGTDRLPLRGIDTTLRLQPAAIARPKLRLDAGLTLFCPTAMAGDVALLEAVLRAGLVELARSDFLRLLDAEARRLGVTFRGPRIADQKTRWGSCSHDGMISLSWRLVFAPPEVSRYVVVHELCHRLHLDHSPRFWAAVTRQLPGYETQRGWLRQYGAALHEQLPNRSS